MSTKRVRIFAGPNGSGKTTIINNLKNAIPFGVYVNADDIEKSLQDNGHLDFKDYNLSVNTTKLKKFFKSSGFSQAKLKDVNLWEFLSVKANKIHIGDKKIINSYLAADIAEFIRQSLLQANISFSYETVMSHESKLTFMAIAKQNGYKVYLYYIATEDPEININRVKIRIAQKGHKVNFKKVTDRYYRSLEFLKDAVKLTNRAYIFDNSGKVSKLIAEVTEGLKVEVIDEKEVPNWFIKYLVD